MVFCAAIQEQLDHGGLPELGRPPQWRRTDVLVRCIAIFRIHEHGAVLCAAARQGLLLLQVATERNWSASQFFEALARKTGVRPSIYDDPATKLFVFRAQVIP